MKSATGAGRPLCEAGVLERPRYYPRQIVTPGDMTLEQTYFRDRMRRHNRLLHGWGVVCGARVVAPPAKNGDPPPAWTVRVTSGYLLAPSGDEVVIDCARTWDVRSGSLSGATGQAPVDDPDPWCSPVNVERSGPVYLAVKFKEILGRPVRVQPTGCGCGENQCVYSRWRDGYELGVLAELPESYASFESSAGTDEDGGDDATDETEAGGCPDCPECPTDPWIVLARVTFHDDGQIDEIDNGTYRRLVISHAEDWQTCEDLESSTAAAGPTTVEEPEVEEPEVDEPAADTEPEPRTRERSRRSARARRREAESDKPETSGE